MSRSWSRAKTLVASAVLTILLFAPVAFFILQHDDWFAAEVSQRAVVGATGPSHSPRQAPAEVLPSPTIRSRPDVSSPSTTPPLASHEPTASKPTRSRTVSTPAMRPAIRHVLPVAGCSTSYARAHHDYPAADVFAARGCLFVAPVTGRVDEVNRLDRWRSATNRGADRGGLMVSVVGRDGVRYYGAHLEKVFPSITAGLVVEAGTPLGRVGDTGSARGVGAHLHFGLSWPTKAGYWWVRRGVVPPAAFLDAWRAGRNSSPVAATVNARRAYGEDSICRNFC